MSGSRARRVPGVAPRAPRALRVLRRTVAVGVFVSGAPLLAQTTGAPAAATPASPTASPIEERDAAAWANSPVAAGDKLVLRVWREPTWSDAFPVDATGVATLPRIGPLHVAGLVPTAIRDTVRTRLAVYLRDPVVDVIVLRRVSVQGAVRKPDVLFVEPIASLQDVVAQAGGLTEDGDPNRIEIVRDGRRIRLGRWTRVAAAPAPVRSGDQVVVGQRSWIARNALAALSSVAVAVSVLVTTFRR